MVEIQSSEHLVGYLAGMEIMESLHSDILLGKKPEVAWLLEHSDVYTKGISGKNEELLIANIPVIETKRGGKVTYHGPGQQICYLIINLKQRAKLMPDIRLYVQCLEEIIIRTLAKFDIIAKRNAGYIGVWVEDGPTQKKIAAIGVKFSKGVTMHGFAINVMPNLTHFSNIIPCGIKEFGVCSMHSIGKNISMECVKNEIIENIKWAQEVNFYQR